MAGDRVVEAEQAASRSDSTAAAVKLLVIDAIRNTLSASGGASSSTRIVPIPRTWSSSPCGTTA